jgi:PAS domain S-box-containing protein
LDTASDLVQISTPDGRLTYVNRAWLEALGYDQQDLGTLTVADIVNPDGRAMWQGVLDRAVRGESLRNLEVGFVRKDGRPMTVEGSLDARSIGDVMVVRSRRNGSAT